MKFPFIYLGKPVQTLCEQRIAAWQKRDGDGLPGKPRITCPVETRKQWRVVQRQKRKSA